MPLADLLRWRREHPEEARAVFKKNLAAARSKADDARIKRRRVQSQSLRCRDIPVTLPKVTLGEPDD